MANENVYFLCLGSYCYCCCCAWKMTFIKHIYVWWIVLGKCYQRFFIFMPLFGKNSIFLQIVIVIVPIIVVKKVTFRRNHFLCWLNTRWVPSKIFYLFWLVWGGILHALWLAKEFYINSVTCYNSCFTYKLIEISFVKINNLIDYWCCVGEALILYNSWNHSYGHLHSAACSLAHMVPAWANNQTFTIQCMNMLWFNFTLGAILFFPLFSTLVPCLYTHTHTQSEILKLSQE